MLVISRAINKGQPEDRATWCPALTKAPTTCGPMKRVLPMTNVFTRYEG